MTGPPGVLPAKPRPAVVLLPAELDIANAGLFGEQLGTALASGASIVIADMTGTTFCDSMGVRMLVRAHRQAAANDAELRLAVPHADVQRGLERMGVRELLSVYGSLDEARAGMAADHQVPGMT
jgi:anti-sigma B factor antagonist